MVDTWIVFCGVVNQVVLSWSPEVSKFPLGFTASEPVETHIHPLCLFWLDGVGYHPQRSSVIYIYRRRWFGVSYFLEVMPCRNCFSAADIESS